MKNKEIELHPIIFNQTYDENCWLIIDVESSNKPSISFFNPNQPFDDDGYEEFKDFMDMYLDENFKFFKDEHEIQIISEVKIMACGSKGKMDEDFDKESRKSFKFAVGEGQIVTAYKGGIPLEEITKLIKEAVQSLESLESDAAYNASDNEAYQKDPYAYYGVSRKMFY